MGGSHPRRTHFGSIAASPRWTLRPQCGRPRPEPTWAGRGARAELGIEAGRRPAGGTAIEVVSHPRLRRSSIRPSATQSPPSGSWSCSRRSPTISRGARRARRRCFAATTRRSSSCCARSTDRSSSNRARSPRRRASRPRCSRRAPRSRLRAGTRSHSSVRLAITRACVTRSGSACSTTSRSQLEPFKRTASGESRSWTSTSTTGTGRRRLLGRRLGLLRVDASVGHLPRHRRAARAA